VTTAKILLAKSLLPLHASGEGWGEAEAGTFRPPEISSVTTAKILLAKSLLPLHASGLTLCSLSTQWRGLG